MRLAESRRVTPLMRSVETIGSWPEGMHLRIVL
jgi:hypothetical protein